VARVRSRRVVVAAFLLLCGGCSVFYRTPEITFGGVSIEGIGRRGASLEISLDVHNPNRYALGLGEMTYRLTLGGVEVTSGAARTPVYIEGKGSATVRLPASLEWNQLGAGGWELLTSGRVDYVVDGEAVFTTPAGSFRRPFRRTGTIHSFAG
jgi:LEA14-like dessication related protein